MSIRNFVRSELRGRGIEVLRYTSTVRAQRQHIFSHYSIDLLVDVGANVGQYASEVRTAGYSGKIFSLEPLSAPYSLLERASQSDPLWDTCQVALGAKAGTVTMHISEGSIFSSFLPVLETTVSASGNAKQVGQEDVEVDTLDALVPDANSCTAVKIDVQGFERDVLQGGSKFLSKVRVVEMELSPSEVYQGQMLLLEAVERLQRSGLILSSMENLFRDTKTGRSLQFNGIFVRP